MITTHLHVKPVVVVMVVGVLLHFNETEEEEFGALVLDIFIIKEWV